MVHLIIQYGPNDTQETKLLTYNGKDHAPGNKLPC